ncbi:MAG: hemolysin family protein [Chloroflexota bacterium]
MTKLLLLGLGIPGLSLAILTGAAAAEGSLPSLTTLILPIAVIIILVFVNGFFVAAEFAIIGVRATQIEQLSNEGNSQADLVLPILEARPDLDQYIATAQLGVTIASLGLAMYGEPQISHFIEPYFEEWFSIAPETANTIGYFVALGLLTYLHVVVGEMVPKALALMDPSSVALSLARPMKIVETVLRFPVAILNRIGNGLLHLFRIPPAEGHERLLAPEELELIVAESTEGGMIDLDEQEIIRNIFDFSERNVEQVMTPRRKVQSIPIDTPRDELLKTVTESRHSRFPVYDSDLDHIVGILHLKDLVRQSMRPNAPFDLRLILRVAPEVPEDYSIELLLAAFKNQKLHMAIVRDEFGGMAGVVTLEDLVEEVVGEVRDEFDQEREPYEEISPGVLEVSGDYLIDDLTDDVYLGTEEELPDVETVGGLIVALLGRPPQAGDEVVYQDGVHFTVLDVDRLAVSRVRVEFPTASKGDTSQTDASDEVEQP